MRSTDRTKSQNIDFKAFLEGKNTTEGIQYMNKYINAIIKGCEEFGFSNEKDDFMKYLAILGTSKNMNKTDYGDELIKISKLVKQSTNYSTLHPNMINDIQKKLNSLGNIIKEGRKNQKGEDITARSISTVFNQNLFSTVFGEAAAAELKTGINGLLVDAIRETGKDSTALSFMDADGNIVSATSKDVNQSSVYAAGKADIMLDNVACTLQCLPGFNGKSFDLKMNLGISNKLYKNINLNEPLKKDSHVSFGGGMNVRLAIDMSFNSIQKRYLAYNVFTWSDKPGMRAPLRALQDILFTRSAINLIGSRGLNQQGNTNDSALFILVNGEVYSLWTIIQTILMDSNKIGWSNSENKTSPITFSIENRPKIDGRKQDLNYKYRGNQFDKKMKSQQYAEKVKKVMQNRANYIYDRLGAANINAIFKLDRLNKLYSLKT
jgi:hypothetical protein